MQYEVHSFTSRVSVTNKYKWSLDDKAVVPGPLSLVIVQWSLTDAPSRHFHTLHVKVHD